MRATTGESKEAADYRARSTSVINLEKVLASLDAVCPKCGKVISPAEACPIDFEHVECAACGERFAAKYLFHRRIRR
jgi:predicted RNA-binding Zn-ribbon protein involved in translation (DUF1610 family)